ncbi:MAG: hypothetical protein RIF36_15020 [Imperialibacter sp.]|uniref:hypothetical protein n=1 Tax=Imperialibacter sp. TaxID=2038411 RepID=UPI0032ECFE88
MKKLLIFWLGLVSFFTANPQHTTITPDIKLAWETQTNHGVLPAFNANGEECNRRSQTVIASQEIGLEIYDR